MEGIRPPGPRLGLVPPRSPGRGPLRPRTGYCLVVPPQAVSSSRVLYRPAPGAILEIHSHHGLPACFSALDNADETRLCLYGIVGCLGQDRPEVALRVGAYGQFLPLPWETVFEGDRGAFRDVPFDPVEERGHELSD